MTPSRLYGCTPIFKLVKRNKFDQQLFRFIWKISLSFLNKNQNYEKTISQPLISVSVDLIPIDFWLDLRYELFWFLKIINFTKFRWYKDLKIFWLQNWPNIDPKKVNRYGNWRLKVGLLVVLIVIWKWLREFSKKSKLLLVKIVTFHQFKN